MQITLHRVGIRDGDQGCLMAGINKPFLISEIADVCRKEWPTKNWGDDTEDNPLFPFPDRLRSVFSALDEKANS